MNFLLLHQSLTPDLKAFVSLSCLADIQPAPTHRFHHFLTIHSNTCPDSSFHRDPGRPAHRELLLRSDNLKQATTNACWTRWHFQPSDLLCCGADAEGTWIFMCLAPARSCSPRRQDDSWRATCGRTASRPPLAAQPRGVLILFKLCNPVTVGVFIFALAVAAQQTLKGGCSWRLGTSIYPSS